MISIENPLKNSLIQINEQVIEKLIRFALSKSDADTFPEQQKIHTIVVVGASTNNSIKAATKTAINLGFTNIVMEDACFTIVKEDYFGAARTAAEVHTISLANLNGEYAQVVNSNTLIKI